MHCSCIRGKYDIHVTPYRDAIVYQDFSDWIEDEHHSLPSFYTVDVLIPESSVPIRLEVGLNHVIKPQDLGLTKIKDGIYCFTVIDCGSKTYDGCCGVQYKIFKLIAPFAECCISNSYATLDRYNETKDIDEMLQQAQISVQLKMLKEAKQQFMYVKKKLKYINCNC